MQCFWGGFHIMIPGLFSAACGGNCSLGFLLLLGIFLLGPLGDFWALLWGLFWCWTWLAYSLKVVNLWRFCDLRDLPRVWWWWIWWWFETPVKSIDLGKSFLLMDEIVPYAHILARHFFHPETRQGWYTHLLDIHFCSHKAERKFNWSPTWT